MRIVYLHQYFRTPAMAGGTRSYEMARRMVQQGHEVHLITTGASARFGEDHAATWATSDEAGITVHWYNLPPYSNTMSNAARIRSFLEFAVRSARKAAALAPDVVLASSTPLTIALPGMYASRRSRAPMVFEVRDLWPEVPIALNQITNPLVKKGALALERLAYRNAAEVIALSPGMKAGVDATGFPEERITVVPNSCDFDIFDVDPELGRRFRCAHEWLGDRPLFVYTGTFGMVNGVGYLARLASKVKPVDPEIRFLLVGSGREEDAVRSLAGELGVLDVNFFMMPEASKKEMATVLSAASMASSTVIDVPELWNNSANKFFDALAAGRPIAINHEGWQADLIRDHDIGLVLDAHDMDTAARQLTTKLRDGSWLARAGHNARALGQAEFSRDKLADTMIGVLERAAR